MFQKIKKRSHITHITGKLGPPLLKLIFDQFWNPFWTSFLESILYLILDPHLGSILVPTPFKMRVPEEILRRLIFDGLECIILERLLDTFLNQFGRCLDRLEIIKALIFSRRQIMTLTSFSIIVTFWCGSHLGLNLD